MFLVDASASMRAATALDDAKAAMRVPLGETLHCNLSDNWPCRCAQSCLSNISGDLAVRFNVVAFGDRSERCFVTSREATRENRICALQFVNNRKLASRDTSSCVRIVSFVCSGC